MNDHEGEWMDVALLRNSYQSF